MLTYKEFEEVMLEIKAWFDRLDAVNACGLWVWDWSQGGCAHVAVDMLMRVMHDTDKWIEYFIFEKDWGCNTELQAAWGDGTPIPLHTLEDLYKLLCAVCCED